MAIITEQNNIRYCIDELDTKTYGVFISDTYGVDCTQATQCTGINLDYNLPTGSELYFLFLIDNSWCSLKSTGEAKIIQSVAPDFETLQENGNTVSELLALKDIPAFVKKNIGVAIGLATSDLNNAIPRVKFFVKCMTDTQILKTSQLSPVYNLSGAQVIKFNAPTTQTGSGKVTVLAQVRDEKNNLSEWKPIENFNGQIINALQFRADYSVNELDTSMAMLDSAQVIYSLGNSITENNSSGELISHTENWYMNIRQCRLTIKHSPLENSGIRAYVALRKSPVLVKGENLGIGTGTKKVYELAHKNGVKYDSVRIYFDNVRQYTDFEINTEVARITCNAPEGVIITCDYEYAWENETWQELEKQNTISFMDYDQSEYIILLPDNSMSVCALKLSLDMTSGNITREYIGHGAGKSQTYKLSRRVDDGSITVYQNDSVLSTKNYYLHDDTQYLTASATAGTNLYATYKWISDTPIIHQFAAVFSE